MTSLPSVRGVRDRTVIDHEISVFTVAFVEYLDHVVPSRVP